MEHSVHLSLPDNLSLDFPDPVFIKRAMRILLMAMSEDSGIKYELSVSVIGDEEIRNLNREYRKKDLPTDVLSFSMLEGDEMPSAGDKVMLGDIVISYETCAEQAMRVGHSVRDEFLRLATHGLLHIFGYDHELSEKEEKRMKEKEDELLDILQESGL